MPLGLLKAALHTARPIPMLTKSVKLQTTTTTPIEINIHNMVLFISNLPFQSDLLA